MPKRPELPEGFQGKGFKKGEGGVLRWGGGECDQLLDILLIGWW